MTSRTSPSPRRQYGFTLAEMAIVMVVVMVLLGGMIATLTGQMDTRNQTQTEQTLADIREALLGFAASQGRLPCPAAPGATGIEAPAGGGTCTNAWNGFVPGITLGIGPTDAQGYVLDAWNQRIHYAITTAQSNAFTTTPGAAGSNVGMRGRGISNLTPDLNVCAIGTGVTTADCGTATTLTARAVAVLISTGRNWATGGGSADEAKNLDNDVVFVSHTPTVASNTSAEFDDPVTWISPYVLYNRMLSAGQLP